MYMKGSRPSKEKPRMHRLIDRFDLFAKPCFFRRWIILAVWISVLAGDAVEANDVSKRPQHAHPNVLLICVDDLRCELGCYGVPGIQTPNLDRLAKQSRLFERHYVQVAACGPSRCTLLTGRRENRAWDVWGATRKLAAAPEQPVSFADFFRRQGYRTVSLGKVSHQPGGTMPAKYVDHQVPFSWDVATGPSGPWRDPWRAFFSYAKGESYNRIIKEVKNEPPRLPYESADGDDDSYADALTAQLAIEQLRDLAERNQPFLLAVGFFKPHLPFNAPKKYWDIYDRDKIPSAPWPKPPANVSIQLPLHDSYEPTSHYHWPSGKGNVNADEGRTLKHGYWAAVSYVDAQIGKLLDEFGRLGLDQNTVVVLWSDHGWQLGDYGLWGKFTNYEWALRSPLMIRTPEITQPGESAGGIVETIDMYPTLADLCGLSAPPDLAGTSLKPMIEDPNHPGKSGAISTVGRAGHLGRTLRTDRYRLVHWENVKTKKTVLVELYDHQQDPLETENIAATQPVRVEQLLNQLNAGKTSLLAETGQPIVAVDDSQTGQIEIRQGKQPVLRYNYRTVEPPDGLLDDVAAGNRKYARARSNYIHPLYGPNGEEITEDWSPDHPHHRGIYWAWPGVMSEGELGDLHALQRVFARPTGKIQLRSGDGFAEVEAENEWRWEDKTPIVNETATIRAYQAGQHGRFVDLKFDFTALTDGVTIARRDTTTYGGLNIRLAHMAEVKLSHHADPPALQPQPAWQYSTGIWPAVDQPATLIVLEHAGNPDYPGDYVQYPNLPWFQPAFPRAGTRFTVPTDKSLSLRYRMWILKGGPPEPDEIRKQWNEYNK
jgi:iduronate 2-sulfatase